MSGFAGQNADANAGWVMRPSRLGSAPGRLAALLLLFITSPLWLIAGAVVWGSLGRPLFFRQPRAGLGREVFTICKFRTMSELRDGGGALLPDRMRQTPATRVLRLTRMDELPQLLAIARGEMAFVGPRPLLPATVSNFGPLGRLRCAVLPGLSGWAQVNGNTRLTDQEKLALDLWYVRHRSLTLDLEILARTVATILLGERVHRANVDRALAAMALLDPANPSRLPRP